MPATASILTEPAGAAAPDTLTDVALAQTIAACDAEELSWLGAAHTRAYNERRTDDCIRILARIRAIKGPAVPPCTRTHRVSRAGRIWRRRAFATGFTTW